MHYASATKLLAWSHHGLYRFSGKGRLHRREFFTNFGDMKHIENLIGQHLGSQLATLRLGEFGVVMPVDKWAHYEHNAFRLSAELGLRLAIRRIPSDVPELYGTVVMRRPLLFEPDGGAFAIVSGHDALHYRHLAGDFMLRCLSDIEQEDAPRFTTYVGPATGPIFLSENRCISEDNDLDLCDVGFDDATPGNRSLLPKASPYPSAPPCGDGMAMRCQYGIIRPTESDEESDLSIEADRKQLMDNIAQLVMAYVARHHEMPPLAELNEHIKGKIIIKPKELSPVVVNGDMRVVLPRYNEMELKMTPLARTVYILFLMHPEGINLKNIGDHRAEIEQIYSLVMPARDDDAARQSIDELVLPGSDSMRQKLSLIRRAVRRQIVDPAIAAHYMVTGSRGTPFRIGLPARQIHLPAVLTL